jgi:hypothetical protein
MERYESFEVGLLEILVRLEAIKKEDAVAIEKLFNDSDVDQFDDFLLSEDIVDEDHILQALSEYYQVPAFDVVGYFFECRYVRMFPKEMLLRNCMIPLEVDENIMIVVASAPNNPDLLSELGQYVSYDIQFYVGLGRDICDAVKEFYDKADTEDMLDEDSSEDRFLTGEFEFLQEGEGDEGLMFTLESEDRFE